MNHFLSSGHFKKYALHYFFGLTGLAAAALVLPFHAGPAAYTTDSVIYFTAAESLQRGEGLLSTNFGLLPVASDFVPVQFYPPGYTLMIALGVFCGLSGAASAVLVPKLCFIALPAAFYFCFRRICARPMAMVLAGINAFMPIMVKIAYKALSDLPFLVLSLITFGMAMKSMEEERKRTIFIAGLLAGACVLVRFLGAAVIIAVLAGLLLAALLKVVPWKKFWWMGVCFAGGCATVLIPYIGYKVGADQSLTSIVNHSLSDPYPLSAVVHETFSLLAYMFLGDKYHGTWFMWLLLGLFVYLCAHAVRLLQCGRIDGKKLVNAAILAIYVLVGFGTIIYMITNYNYYLDDRYLVQYSWIIMAALIYLIGRLLAWASDRYLISPKPFAVIILTAFLVIQTTPAIDGFVLFFERRNQFYKNLATAEQALRAIPGDHVIVSNAQDLLYLMLQRNVRMLGGYSPLTLDRMIGGKSEFVVVLLLEGLEGLDTWRPVTYGRVPVGYRMYFNNGSVAILKRIGPHQLSPDTKVE